MTEATKMPVSLGAQEPFLPQLPAPLIDEAVRAALREDLGRAGDITSNATIPPQATAKAVLVARGSGILCGMPLAQAAFVALDSAVTFQSFATDGEHIEAGQLVAEISGNARAILAAERVALNYLMRMSGIAGFTDSFRQRIADTGAKICCTRKTVPGHRAFDKYAVKCGGGSNHRFGLDDGILIKDNHIAVCGGVALAMARARSFAGHLVAIEVEVDTLEQLREALECGPDAVLLDNMNLEMLAEAVRVSREAGARAIPLEASGNVRLETVRAIAETGVDYISSSRITMAAPTLDIGLDMTIS
jgi:nicotinate-nucleotide pyrophosphorylase (carboxylating)